MKNFLENHANKNAISFHMPGHKGFGIFNRYGYGEFLTRIPEWDITEIPGADNLFHPEGIIKETMEDYKELYEARESYLLINGTSSGIMGALLGTVPKGKTVLAARNCHKSVQSGIELGSLNVEYVYPELLKEGILGEVKAETIEAALALNDDVEAVILPSP
ncbi:MAG: decarboxylase, partial [Anaerovoracaceae bacterium]